MDRFVRLFFVLGFVLFLIGSSVALTAVVRLSVVGVMRTQVVYDEKPLVISAGWFFKSYELVDEIVEVSWWTYDYVREYTPWVGEGMNFVISGSVIELSSPQCPFNFYVFDSDNFYLWLDGKKYTAFFEAKNAFSTSFSFTIASEEDLPSSFYFVVEEVDEGSPPTVRVEAKMEWIEKTSRYYCSNCVGYKGSISGEDFTVKGTVEEVNNRKFNFYVFDYDNYQRWLGNQTYMAYFESKDIIATTFKISFVTLPSELYFVVENPSSVDEQVVISITIQWKEKSLARALPSILAGIIISIMGFGTVVMVVLSLPTYLSLDYIKAKAKKEGKKRRREKLEEKLLRSAREIIDEIKKRYLGEESI